VVIRATRIGASVTRDEDRMTPDVCAQSNYGRGINCRVMAEHYKILLNMTSKYELG